MNSLRASACCAALLGVGTFSEDSSDAAAELTILLATIAALLDALEVHAEEQAGAFGPDATPMSANGPGAAPPTNVRESKLDMCIATALHCLQEARGRLQEPEAAQQVADFITSSFDLLSKLCCPAAWELALEVLAPPLALAHAAQPILQS